MCETDLIVTGAIVAVMAFAAGSVMLYQAKKAKAIPSQSKPVN